MTAIVTQIKMDLGERKLLQVCMDNKWGKCKACFPRPTAPATTVDPETGYITIKKFEA